MAYDLLPHRQTPKEAALSAECASLKLLLATQDRLLQDTAADAQEQHSKLTPAASNSNIPAKLLQQEPSSSKERNDTPRDKSQTTKDVKQLKIQLKVSDCICKSPCDGCCCLTHHPTVVEISLQRSYRATAR